MYATANVLALAIVFCLSESVELQEAVSIYISDGGITPVVGVSYNLTCNVTADVTSYRWLKDGQQINDTEGDTLVLPSLDLTDIGNYTCEVEINSTNYSANISISALHIPAPTSVVVTSNISNPIRPIGTDIPLTCTVVLSPALTDGDIQLKTVWTGPAGFMATNTAQPVMGSTTTYTSTVMVSSFGRDQSGNYTCTATVGSNSSLLINSTLRDGVRVTTGVYLSHNGDVLMNNSNILIDTVGTSLNDEQHPVMCVSDKTPCCLQQGEWVFPNGSEVAERSQSQTYYTTRGNNGSVNLFRVATIEDSPTGTFCCEIEDATNTSQTLCVNIFSVVIRDDGAIPVEGQSYTLNCSVSGIDIMTLSYEWIRENAMTSNKVNNNQLLSFRPLRLNDAGQYTCQVTTNDCKPYNRTTEIFLPIICPSSVHVIVTSDPPSPIQSIGSIVSLTCTVTVMFTSSLSENALVTITWNGPDVIESVLYDIKTCKSGPNTPCSAVATIDSFGKENAGYYICTVSTVNFTVPDEMDNIIYITNTEVVAPIILVSNGIYITLDMTVLGNNTDVSIGDITNSKSGSLVCHITNLNLSNVDKNLCDSGLSFWKSPNDDFALSNGDFNVTYTDQCTLNLYRINDNVNLTSSTGKLCCTRPTIMTIPGDRLIRETVCINSVSSLTIIEAPVPPMVGMEYHLTCNYTSKNNATVYRWRKNDAEPMESNQTLHFSSLRLSNAGLYSCNASGVNYSVNKELLLQIPSLISVNITSDPPSPIAPGRSNVTVTCTVELSPAVVEPDLTLLAVDTQLFRDGHVQTLTGLTRTGTTFKYTIRLDSFDRSDSGNYTCTATVNPQPNAIYLRGSDSVTDSTYISTGVYLYSCVNEQVISNNSDLPIMMVGNESKEALLCFTDLLTNDTGEVGLWYFPNSSAVEESGDVYTTRGDGVVRLHRKDNVTMPTGLYRCEIPDASGTYQSIYVNIESAPSPSTTTSNSNVSPTPAPFPAASAAAGAAVGGLLLIIIVGVVLAILIVSRRRKKDKGSFQVTELEYIHKNKGSIEPTDVPSPEVAVESKEEQLTQEVAVESRDEQLALEVAVESRSERLIEDQPDALEEGKGEAIYMQLTEQESIHKSPSEELKSEDIKSEDEETASLNSDCEYGKVVPLAEFTKHVESFHADRDKLFEMEYTNISRLPQLHVSVAKIPHNKLKNRFGNIFPYDDTRVKLQEIDGEEGSDYINANYLDGYEKPKAYIAAQGPMPNTVNDFWRMVWEYKLSTIVMLTRCFEGRVKCEAYWPTSIGERKDIGHNLIVNLISELPFAEYYIRKMTVTHTDGTSMDIVQYHFIGWPDHGVPMNGIGLINFIKRVRKLHPYSEPRPLLVHCSAGVGRTGAFIVLDSMMERMKSEDTLNIYEFVNHLRTQRVLMVQTQVQYNFIHDVLNEMILTGNTEILATNFRIVMKQLNSVRDGESGYSKQLRIIGQVVPKPSEAEYTNASTEKNRSKNRYQNVLPNDHYRVMLRAIADFDYINASFIDGYRQRGAYIATQIPLQNTVNDFWKMVWEYQTRSIVVLCKMEEDVETYQNILPESEDRANSFGKVIVKVLSKKAMTDYEVKQVELYHDNSSEKMEVTVFHYLSWNKDGTLEGKPMLLELIEQVNKKQMGSGNRPITVVCNDGIGRTGTFISIHAQLERLKTEGVVDFFQFVKSARFQRAGIVPEVNHYMVCHNMVAEYLDKFEIYANFKEIV